MRRPLHRLLSLVVFLALSLAACAGETKPRFTPGYYEQLMLAVDAKGKLTGYYREEQGEGVVKTCAFFLSGSGTSSEVPIVTWNDQAFPGTLTAQKDGVTLKIEKGREHPGCGLVLLPQISKGLALDQVASAQWSELRRIGKDRTYFHSSPDASKVLKTFVVSGDIVGVLAQSGEWLQVEYRGKKATSKGWILAKDAATLVPPKR